MARIRHLAILTEDVEKLVKFYATAFGLKIVHGVGTAIFLSDGHIDLAIIRSGRSAKSKGRICRWASIILVSRWRMSPPSTTLAKN